MKRLTFALALLFHIPITQGQPIPKTEADSLLKALKSFRDDKDRISIFFRLAQYQIFKPGEYKVDLDSAETYLNKAAALNTKIKSIDAEGFGTLIASDLARERGQKDSARAMAERAVRILETGTNKSYLAEASIELATYYDFNESKQRAEMIRLAVLAAENYKHAGNIERQAHCLDYLADLYLVGNDSLYKALQTLDLCVKTHESIHDHQLTQVYILYGKLYYQMGNTEQTLHYQLLALKNLESDGLMSMSLCEINNSIGNTLIELKETRKARGYFKNALRIAEQNHDFNNFAVIVYNTAMSFLHDKEPDSALLFLKALPKDYQQSGSQKNYFMVLVPYLNTYTALKKFPEAQFYADKLVELINTHKFSHIVFYSVGNRLIDYYLATHQYAAARFYIGKEEIFTREFENIAATYNYHKFRLDTAQGQYRSALTSLLAYMKVKDSGYDQISDRHTKQLEVEYQTEKKEHELELREKDIQLLQAQTRFQENSLKQAAFVRKLSFGGIILLLAVVSLIFSRYRIKQRQKKEIDEKNAQLKELVKEKDGLIDTKEWLLKELHHRVKNNLQVMMSLQQLQARNLTSEEALTAVNDSSNRLYAMSLIHQKLYKSDGPDQINMGQYIGELVRHLAEAFATIPAVIMQTELEPDIDLDVTQAIPVGLILNEAITNTFKYAFAGRAAENSNGARKPAILRVTLLATGLENEIELSIKDNGRGYVPPEDKNQRRSLGFSLMEALAEELDGTLTVLNDEGLTVILRFTPYHGRDPQKTAPLEASFA
jgi:two-component sensor histidine kinase